MTIPQLMARLAALFPADFQHQASIDAWTERFRVALGNVEPAILEDAFDALMTEWSRRGAPRPSNLRLHCDEARIRQAAQKARARQRAREQDLQRQQDQAIDWESTWTWPKTLVSYRNAVGLPLGAPGRASLVAIARRMVFRVAKRDGIDRHRVENAMAQAYDAAHDVAARSE